MNALGIILPAAGFLSALTACGGFLYQQNITAAAWALIAALWAAANFCQEMRWRSECS